jgi:hypothetical protein
MTRELWIKKRIQRGQRLANIWHTKAKDARSVWTGRMIRYKILDTRENGLLENLFARVPISWTYNQ